MNNQEIGKNAGLVWQILDNKGEMQINALWDLTELSIVDFYLALGWLAREKKVLFYERGSQKWICLIY